MQGSRSFAQQAHYQVSRGFAPRAPAEFRTARRLTASSSFEGLRPSSSRRVQNRSQAHGFFKFRGASPLELPQSSEPLAGSRLLQVSRGFAPRAPAEFRTARRLTASSSPASSRARRASRRR